MMNPSSALLEAIEHLVDALPLWVVNQLAGAIADSEAGAWVTMRRRAWAVLAEPHYRHHVTDLIAVWESTAANTAPASVALALQAAAYTREQARQAQTLELVWTGPASRLPLRRTEQALSQLIDEARQSLVIVSFAVYNIPLIGRALARAAERGVQIRLVVESAQAGAGKVAFDNLSAFGSAIRQQADVYRWPLEHRPTDDEGRHGSLHVKCAVADRRLLFISSANLTHYALTLNMELGVLVRGGQQPQLVADHFEQLISSGVLVRV